MAWLGFIELVVFFGSWLAVILYIARRFGPSIERNKRKRQIETQMHQREFDRQLIDEVASEWDYDPRNHRRR